MNATTNVSFDLSNKIALVSGGSRGIGKSICKALAAHGAHVIVASRKAAGGSVINVASINGVKPGALQGIYSISKAAVISMTQAFAKECASMGVRVNALLPGLTDTKFASALVKNDEIRETVLKDVPLNRVAQPDEMAGAVLYLASAASSYTTGSCITVDGGYLS